MLFRSSRHSAARRVFQSWSESTKETDLVCEENEEVNDTATHEPLKLTPSPDQVPSTRARSPVYPASIRSASSTESQFNEHLPSRPTLTSGDETLSGTAQSVTDKTVSVQREWHAVVIEVLTQCDYCLFLALPSLLFVRSPSRFRATSVASACSRGSSL